MSTNFRARILAVSAALAVFAALGAGTASAADVSAEAKPDSVSYKGGPVAIRGALTADPGVSAAGRVLKLYERPFPYKRSKQVARTTTDANGSYVFSDLNPELNTTYKVAISDPDLAARSKAELVVVFARGKLRVRATKSRDIISKFKLRYSPKLSTKLSGRKVLWYFNKVGKPRFTVADRTRSKQARKGVLKGKSRFTAPRGNYRFRVTYCLDVPDKKDIGIGPPGAPRNCPGSFPAETSRALRAVASGALAS